MKAVFIDSKNKTVTDVDIPKQNTLQAWYKVMGVEMVEVGHYLNEHDSILVDEEGLLKPVESWFAFEGAHQPFAGNGLVVGVDRNGNSVSCNVTAEQVKSKVMFLSTDAAKATF